MACIAIVIIAVLVPLTLPMACIAIVIIAVLVPLTLAATATTPTIPCALATPRSNSRRTP